MKNRTLSKIPWLKTNAEMERGVPVPSQRRFYAYAELLILLFIIISITTLVSGVSADNQIKTEVVVIRASVGPYLDKSPYFLPISSDDLTGHEGAQFVLGLVAIDPEGVKPVLNAEEIPDWANFDPDTGILSGTPPKPGEYPVIITATDGNYIVKLYFTITVSVNHFPSGSSQSVTTTINTDKVITLAGFDTDGDPLSYTIVDSPSHGILSGTAPNLVYTPEHGYHGPDSFTYRVNDGQVDSPLVIVTITVTTPSSPQTGGASSSYLSSPFVMNQNTGQFQSSWLVTAQENGVTHYTIYRNLANQAGYHIIGTSTDASTGRTTIRIMDSNGNVIEIETTGLIDEAGQIDGIIESVYVVTAPAQAHVGRTGGRVSAYFRYQIGNCGLLSKIKTEILESIDALTAKQITDAATTAGYIVNDLPFIVSVTIEPPCTTGNSSLFLTVNSDWVYDQLEGTDLTADTCALSGYQPGDIIPNLVIVHIDDNNEEEVLPAQWVTVCPDDEGNIKIQVDASHLSIYGMVAVKAKETAGVTTAPNPDVAPMLVPGGVGFEAYLTQNPVLIVGVVAFLILLVFLESRFHILRRKEYKPLEGPEGGPPVIEGLIETDRQKALSGIIDVLNDVDGQIRDLETTLAKRAPGFVVAPAEADAIVEKFFYGCQVAEERIKTAAAADHISKRQVEHLNGQLKDAVDRMVQTSQKSAVLAQAVQARLGTGAASAGGET